jgi:DNA-binding response OmpR family regulator
MLTAKDDVSDKVMGLDMGADDYMTKPFAIEELLARIRVGLKKHRAVAAAPAANVLTAGKLVLDPAKYSVTMDGTPISLTKKEFDLLKYLMQHKGQAVTRDALLSDVWGYDYAGDTNVVDVYIRYLRHKIDEPFGVKTLHTIRAVGYMFSYE